MEVTAAMVGNFLAGGAASSVLAQTHNIPLTVIDVGVDTPYPQPRVTRDRYQKYSLSGGDISREPALNHEDFYEAVMIGRRCVASLDPTLNLLILGEMGIGNTTPSAAIACALLSGSVEDLVGRGTGIDDETRALKQNIVTQALNRWRADQDPDEHRVIKIMRHLGGREIVAIFGAMLEAIQRGVAILVDGFIISAAALALVTMYPEARPLLLFSHRSQERGHRLILEAMRATPLLELELRLGEASGALTAYPILRAACALHGQMATFAEAAVPNKEERL
jgi:nicotinate-nucleotide--dimethylbenzimidazole phosphoribosyltransferase